MKLQLIENLRIWTIYVEKANKFGGIMDIEMKGMIEELR